MKNDVQIVLNVKARHRAEKHEVESALRATPGVPDVKNILIVTI